MTAFPNDTSMALAVLWIRVFPRLETYLDNMPEKDSAVSQKTRKPGFYYGWVIVIVIGLGGFTQSAESYPILGVFMKPMTEEFQWSRTIFTGSRPL